MTDMNIIAQGAPIVLRESTTLNVLQSRLHGLDHWFRVWKHSQMLGGRASGVDLEIVAMYALFHDSMRLNDGEDPEHGIRGFRLWIHIRDTHGLDRLFDHRQEEKLFEAVVEHNSGLRTTDPTIAVCWDADRLDLHRKGIWPDARFMSTQEGIALCMTRIHPGRRTS
jgi:uncharacterized protein